MQIPLTGLPSSVCPVAGGAHDFTGTGAYGVYVQPPPLQVPGDPWQTSGGLVQSLSVQQLATGMHALPQSLSPPGHAQPAAVHSCPPAHAIEPLHVHVPPLHVFVVD